MAYSIVSRPHRDELGEGPHWSPAQGVLWWVDIFGQAVSRLSLADGRVDRFAVPERIGWVIARADRGDLLAGFRSGIAALTLDPLVVTPLVRPEPDRPHNRLNDAKRDAAGRIWFGSKDDRDESASGALYSLEPDGRVVRHDDGYRVTNGPAFSPAGDRLYHTDSGRGCVYCYPLRDDGTLGPRRSFITFPPEWGVPDGMTTDRDGCLWIAHWGGGCLSRFDPDGRRMQSIALPASNITSCAFAGDALDRLFVTSAAVGTTDEPHAGALFEVEVDTPGLPVH